MAEDFEKLLAKIGGTSTGRVSTTPKIDDDFEGTLSKIAAPPAPVAPKVSTAKPGRVFSIVNEGDPASWSLSRLPEIEQEYKAKFGKPLPYGRKGQGSGVGGWDHRNNADVDLTPGTPEAQWLEEALRARNIPFRATPLKGIQRNAQGRIISTGDHYHLGPPSGSLGRRVSQSPTVRPVRPAQPQTPVVAPVQPITPPVAPVVRPEPVQNPGRTITQTFTPGQSYFLAGDAQLPLTRGRRAGQAQQGVPAQIDPVTVTYGQDAGRVVELTPEQQEQAVITRSRVTPETVEARQQEARREAQRQQAQLRARVKQAQAKRADLQRRVEQANQLREIETQTGPVTSLGELQRREGRTGASRYVSPAELKKADNEIVQAQGELERFIASQKGKPVTSIAQLKEIESRGVLPDLAAQYSPQTRETAQFADARDLIRQQVVSEQAGRRGGSEAQAAITAARDIGQPAYVEDETTRRLQQFKEAQRLAEELRASYTPEDKERIRREIQNLNESGWLSRAVQIGTGRAAASVDDLAAGILRVAQLEGPAEMLAARGQTYRDVTDEVIRRNPQSAGERAISTAAEIIPSLGTAYIATTLGGPVGGFAALGGLQSYGRGEGVGRSVTEAAKGAVIGKVFQGTHAAPLIPKIAAVAGTATALEKATGASDEEAAGAALTNGLFAAFGGKNNVISLSGRLLRLWRNGKPTYATVDVDKNGLIRVAATENAPRNARNVVDMELRDGVWTPRLTDGNARKLLPPAPEVQRGAEARPQAPVAPESPQIRRTEDVTSIDTLRAGRSVSAVPASPMGVVGTEQVGRPVATQERVQSRADEMFMPEAAPVQKYVHTDFGEVVASPNQSGVARNKIRVVDAQGIEHIIQRPKMRGRGNERAVPVRDVVAPQEVDDETTATLDSGTVQSTTGLNRGSAVYGESLPASNVPVSFRETDVGRSAPVSREAEILETEIASLQRQIDGLSNRQWFSGGGRTAGRGGKARLRQIDASIRGAGQAVRLAEKRDALQRKLDRINSGELEPRVISPAPKPAPISRPQSDVTKTLRAAKQTLRMDGAYTAPSGHKVSYRSEWDETAKELRGFVDVVSPDGQTQSIEAKSSQGNDMEDAAVSALKSVLSPAVAAGVRPRVTEQQGEQPTKREARQSVKVEKIDKTGLTRTQKDYLAGELTQRVTKLAPERGTAEYYEFMKGREEAPAVTIKVPGDGEFTVRSQTQANKLFQKITGKPIDGFEKAKGTSVSIGTPQRVRSVPDRTTDDYVDWATNAYGGVRPAAKKMRALLEQIRGSKTLSKEYEGREIDDLEAAVNELEARSKKDVQVGDTVEFEDGTGAKVRRKIVGLEPHPRYPDGEPIGYRIDKPYTVRTLTARAAKAHGSKTEESDFISKGKSVSRVEEEPTPIYRRMRESSTPLTDYRSEVATERGRVIREAPEQMDKGTVRRAAKKAINDLGELRKNPELERRVILEDLRGKDIREIARQSFAEHERHRVKINNEAQELIRRSVEQMHIEDGDSIALPSFDGLFIPPKRVERLKKVLRRVSNAFPETKLRMDKLIRAVDFAAQYDGSVVLYNIPEAIPHEEFHRGSFLGSAGVLLENRHSDLQGLIKSPTFQKAKRELLKYYENIDARLVEEAAAHISEGNYAAIGLTDVEATEWLFQWFKSYVKKNGVQSLDRFEETTDETRQVINAVRGSLQGVRGEQRGARGRAEESDAGASEGEGQKPTAYASQTKRQVETPEFKRWFGNSKVVNEKGEPLVVYHGTASDFTTFDKSQSGKATAQDVTGFYFTESPQGAAKYAGFASMPYARPNADENILPVYLSLQNPKTVHVGTSEASSVSPEHARTAKRQGYDGLIIEGSGEAGTGFDKPRIFVVFNPSQIKSATGNRGTFSSTDPNILRRSPRHAEAGFIRIPSVESIKRGAVDVANLPRAVMTSFDLSAPLRQGAIFTLTEPKLAVKALKDMIRGISSQRYSAFKRNLDLHPMIELAEEAGLHLSSLADDLAQKEEVYMSSFADKIPGVKHSQQAYVSYLDSIRIGAFEKYVRELKAAGLMDTVEDAANETQRLRDAATAAKKAARGDDVKIRRINERLERDLKSVKDALDKELEPVKAIAKFINAATGRGNLGKTLNNAAPILNAIFFSPRYLASRIQLLNPRMYARVPPKGKRLNPLNYSRGAQRIAFRKMFEFAGIVGLTLLLVKLAGDAFNDELPDDLKTTVEIEDPTKADWMKVKVGNTRYDIGAGFQQILRFAARLSDAFYRQENGEKLKDYQTPWAITVHFLRTKLNPNASLGYDYLLSKREKDSATGEMRPTNVIGEPVYLLPSTDSRRKFSFGQLPGSMARGEFQPGAIGERIVPMIVSEAYDGWKESGAVGVAKTAPSIFGIGSQTYERAEKPIVRRQARPATRERTVRRVRAER